MATTVNTRTVSKNPLIRAYAQSSWRLAAKLLSIILLAVLIPQIIANAVEFALTRNSAIDQVGDTVLTQSATNASISSATYLANQLDILQSVSFNQQVLTFMSENDRAYTGEPSDIRTQIRELDEQWVANDLSSPTLGKVISDDPTLNPINQTLISYRQKYPQIVELVITDKYGATLALSDRTTDYYQADESWWQFSYNNAKGAVFIDRPQYDESSDTFGMIVAYPVLRDNGDVLGIIRATITIQPIFDLLDESTIGETGRAGFYTNIGNLVHYSGDETLSLSSVAEEGNTTGIDPLYPQAVLEIVNADGFTTLDASNGERTIYAHSTLSEVLDESILVRNIDPAFLNAIQNLGWQFIFQQSEAEATEQFLSSSTLPFIFSLLLDVAGVALAYFLIRTTTRQAEVMQPVFTAIEEGDYSARAEVFTNDELGETAAAFNRMLDNTVALIQSEAERDAIQDSVMTLLTEVSQVAEGDLTVEAEVRNDMTGAIADSFNFMIEQLRDIINNVQGATLEVSSSASQIQSTAVELVSGSESQATQIVDTTAAVDEMSISIQQVSENANLSASVGEQARANAQIGSQAVKDTIAGMDRIRDEVETTAERLERLGASSREIGKITKLINDISERTSILAINASIQASEAGEAGRGFAVVAEEVERLSDRSALAARQINRLTSAIQDETSEVTSAMESTSREVARGSKLAQQAGERLNEIELVSNQLSDLIQSISQAAQQQARGSEAIAHSMNEIAGVTKQTAAGTKQATSSIGKLAQMADELRESVSQFKIINDEQMLSAAGD